MPGCKDDVGEGRGLGELKSQISQGFEHGAAAKSEIRNPKSEGNPKAEIRKYSSPANVIGRLTGSTINCHLRPAQDSRRWPVQAPASRHFGLRFSGFGFPSDFGSRISDFCRPPCVYPKRPPALFSHSRHQHPVSRIGSRELAGGASHHRHGRLSLARARIKPTDRGRVRERVEG